MKILLNPRSAEAYGQDFLANALRETCELTMLTATNGGYDGGDGAFRLVVSMNLDEKADSDFVCALPNQVKAIAHVHCRYHFYSNLQRENLTVALRHVSIGIALAEFHRTELKAVFPNIDWRVVHNGVDRTRYTVATEEECRRFRRQLGISGGAKVVLFTGRLEDAKGLQVLREFAQNISGTDLLLLVQFPANSHRAMNAYMDIAKELREQNRKQIVLYPDTDLSTERPIRFADLLITPSLSEVAPLVVLEAFNAGVRVIGTGSTPFYEELPSNGIPTSAYTFVPFPTSEGLDVERQSLRVADSTAASLAEALTQLAANSPTNTYTERCNLSQAAYSAGFDQDTMLTGFRAIYDEALGN